MLLEPRPIRRRVLAGRRVPHLAGQVLVPVPVGQVADMGVGAQPHSLLHRILTAVDRAPQFLRSDPGGLDRPGWIAADREPALLPAESVVEHEGAPARSEEHTSELQSLMRISYAVFC